MMWFITIASRKGGNKQFSNWVANLRLRHKEILVGLVTILLKEWEKDCLWNGQAI
jgi:hypothetical protein